MNAPRSVRCPICGKTVAWTSEAKWRPFCSERCKMIDFGAWASERYRIPAVERDEDDGAPPADDRS